MITVTDTAANALRNILERKQLSSAAGLRISVEKGGCAGLQYVMTVTEPQPSDLNIPHPSGALFYVAADCVDLLKGCHIDYALSLNDSGFKIRNPNATRSCGCGTSFESTVAAPQTLPEGKPCV
jgi:iron-sulfur cluster assembly accessory protein